MTGRGRISIVFMVLACCAFFFSSTNVVHSKPIEISYSNFFPPTHVQAQLGDAWGKEIEKRTGGKVKVTYYPGGALLKGPKIYGRYPQGYHRYGHVRVRVQ